MAGYGAVAILLMFAISFTLFVGGGVDEFGDRRFASGFLEFVDTFDQEGASLFDALLDSFLSPEVLLGGVLTAIVASVASFSVTYTLPALAFSVLATWFLFPLSFLSESAMPVELRWLIYGFFVILMILSFMSYARGTQL